MSTDSPDVFRAQPGRGAGVRRMNRLPLLVVFGVAVLVMGVVMYTIMERTDEGNIQRKAAEKKPDPATSVGIFDNAPEAGMIAAKEPPKPANVEPAAVVVDQSGVPQPMEPADLDMYKAEWQQYRQQQGQVRQAQLQTALAALTATPTIGSFTESEKSASAASASGEPSFPKPPAMPDFSGKIDRIAALAQQSASGAGLDTDANNAKGKRAFLDSQPNPADYLSAGRTAPVSPYEIKTGTVIPGVMVGGINSDLPGQIIGQVRENVWDTATGKYLLIPQGARLVGTYDNQVTRGQSRVLVAWTRIIYPDGSALDLGSMPGSDQGGYSGFHDKVNNHYVRVFGDALLMSLFSAGIQLSQPDSNNLQGGYSSQQIIAGSLGQQLGQAGMQLTQRNLNIQPTLKIRPGYRFNVMVTKDMVLSPWRGHAG